MVALCRLTAFFQRMLYLLPQSGPALKKVNSKADPFRILLSGLSAASVPSVNYSYDAASRLDTVTSGANTAS